MVWRDVRGGMLNDVWRGRYWYQLLIFKVTDEQMLKYFCICTSYLLSRTLWVDARRIQYVMQTVDPNWEIDMNEINHCIIAKLSCETQTSPQPPAAISFASASSTTNLALSALQ